MTAIVAHFTAVAIIVLFPKVMKQETAPARGRFSIGHHFLHELRAHLPFRHRFIPQEFLQFQDIFVGVKGDAPSLQAIPAGAAGFLVIIFNTFGNIIMDHKPDVRFVDPHSKGDSGYDHIHFFHQEIILGIAAGFGVQAGVIRRRFNIVDGKGFSNLLRRFPALHIDDAGLVRHPLDHLSDLLDGLFLFPLGAHFIIEVSPIERGDKRIVHVHAQVFHDIGLHLRRGGGSEGHDRYVFADAVEHGTDAAVLGPEVMAPFRNTVGFIHRYKGNAYLFKKLDVFVLGKGFGCDKEQLGLTIRNILFDLLHLRFRQRRVQKVSNLVFLAIPTDRVHLILHQGNKRRDNDRRTFQHQGGQLITKGFAAARRHNYKSVFTIQNTFDNSLLLSFETVEPKVLL